MKIIHCADIHLGSKLESKFPKEKSDIRRIEVLNTFNRMIDYANDNGIKIIILSGDVFDKDKPKTKDKENFYKAIEMNPQIDFLYLKGNHDKDGAYLGSDFANLKRFDKENFTSYEYDGVCISGIEMDQSNAKTFYSQLSLDKNKLNIVMLHGDVTDSVGMDKVKIDMLKNKGIDYLALGHIHSYKYGKIDDRGIYAFSGCLEGRGFDETGEKGFIELDVTDKIAYKFIPFASRTIYDVDVDITGCSDLYDIKTKVTEAVKDIDKENILRINLVGEVSVDTDFNEKDIEVHLSKYFFVDVKNKTTIKLNVDDYNDDKSLIGEFIRGVYNNNEYSDEEKQKIVSMGLRLISGKEVE